MYNSVAVESTIMCCAEPDCNAPDPQLDTLTKTGPTITQALLQQDPSLDTSTIRRVYKAAPEADGEVVPLPRILQTQTNGNTGIIYNMAGPNSVGVDANEQANSMLEYQLLQSGVMPMGAEGYAGAYGGYGADSNGGYGGLANTGASPATATATSTPDNSAGTLENGQYTTSAPVASSSATAQATAAAATASSTKTSGASAVQVSLSVLVVLAGAAVALSY